MKTIGALKKGRLRAAASGVLPNGKPVVVNTDGTVSVVAASGGSPAFGTATVFEEASTSQTATGFDSNSNRIVIAYTDAGNSNNGTAVVGQVSGTSLAFGTPVVFSTGYPLETAITFDSNLNKIVIAYSDNSSSEQGLAIVGTVDPADNSISFGTAAVFNTGIVGSKGCVFDSNSNKVVISYRLANKTGYSNVGTVSGTSISFATVVGFNTASSGQGSTFYVGSVFDSTNNKVVIAYRGPSNYGTGIVGTVASGQISFGTATAYTSNVANYNKIVFDSDSNRVAIFYGDAGNSGYGTGVVGTISSTSISFGTPVVLVSSNTTGFAPVFDTTVNKTMVFYQNEGNTNKGYYVFGTISNTAISFTSPVLFNDATTYDLSSTFDSNSNTIVAAYKNGGNSSYGTAIAYQASPGNLTSENYVGMSSGGSVASGSSARVDILGTVNEAQTSLTAGQSYYVQTDGTIGLAADDPSVFAGTAISATKLLVKS